LWFLPKIVVVGAICDASNMVSRENDSVAVGLHSREELFLKSRQQRTFVKKIHEEDPNEDNVQSRRLFWSGFKQYCHDWTQRLYRSVQTCEMDGSNQVDMLFQNEQKLMLELDQFQQELNDLRHVCLQSKDANRRCSPLSPILLTPPDNLPLADLRSLHRDFTALQTLLDGTRKEAFPNHENQPLFVFRKYRRYLRQQQSTSQEESSLPRVSGMRAAVASPPKKTLPVFPCDSTLEDYNYAIIVVQEDGRVEFSGSDGSVMGSSMPEKTHSMKITSAILVIRNVRHCTIHWYVRRDMFFFQSFCVKV
jgi:hypothetical protein